MSSLLRQFARSLQTPGQPPSTAGGTSSPPPNTPGQAAGGTGNTPVQPIDATGTDWAGLGVDPNDSAPWITDKDGTRVGNPKPDVDYNFCFKVVNKAIDRSDPFYIEFKLTGPDNWQSNYLIGNGMKAGGSFVACVPYGAFPDNEKPYELTACVFAMDDQHHFYGQLFCGATFMFIVRP